jgi:hypothetical protein
MDFFKRYIYHLDVDRLHLFPYDKVIMKKIYNFFGLPLTILLGLSIALFLVMFWVDETWPVASTVNSLGKQMCVRNCETRAILNVAFIVIDISALASIFFILKGGILYFRNKLAKQKYKAKKLFMRGLIGFAVILSIIILFNWLI